jgi:archaellum component FlaC
MFEKLTEEELLLAHRDSHIAMSKELCAFNNTLNRLDNHLKELEKLGEENISTDSFAHDNLVDDISSDAIFLRASYINICNVANTLVDEDGEIYQRILSDLREDVKREEYTNEQLRQIVKTLG